MPLMPCCGMQVDGHKSHGQPHHRADEHGSQHTQPQISGGECHIEGRKGAQQHLPFDAQVEHAAALTKGLTDGSIQVGSCQADPEARMPIRTVTEKRSEIMRYLHMLCWCSLLGRRRRFFILPCAASLRLCRLRRQISLLTTKTTTSPFRAVTNADGTCTTLCMLVGSHQQRTEQDRSWDGPERMQLTKQGSHNAVETGAAGEAGSGAIRDHAIVHTKDLHRTRQTGKGTTQQQAPARHSAGP